MNSGGIKMFNISWKRMLLTPWNLASITQKNIWLGVDNEENSKKCYSRLTDILLAISHN